MTPDQQRRMRHVNPEKIEQDDYEYVLDDATCCICGAYLHGGVPVDEGYAHEWCARAQHEYTPEWADDGGTESP